MSVNSHNAYDVAKIDDIFFPACPQYPSRALIRLHGLHPGLHGLHPGVRNMQEFCTYFHLVNQQIFEMLGT
jgi:hypothetical protein